MGHLSAPRVPKSTCFRQFNLFHILPEFQKFSRLEHAVQSTTAAASKLARVLRIRRRNAAVFAKFLRSSAPRAESPTTHTRVDSARPESHPPFKADAGPTTRPRIRTASGCVPKKNKNVSFICIRPMASQLADTQWRPSDNKRMAGGGIGGFSSVETLTLNLIVSLLFQIEKKNPMPCGGRIRINYFLRPPPAHGRRSTRS